MYELESVWKGSAKSDAWYRETDKTERREAKTIWLSMYWRMIICITDTNDI